MYIYIYLNISRKGFNFLINPMQILSLAVNGKCFSK